MTLNVADLYEAVAAAVPERPAIVCDGHRLTFAELDVRANRFANALIDAGIRPGEHVGIHILNGVEYVEALLGCLKVRTVPININFRYTAPELRHLYQDSSLVSLVVAEEFTDAAAAVAAECPALRHALVADTSGTEGNWPGGVTVAGYETALGTASGLTPYVGQRSPDDRYVLYTGGTTGLPKGVVWRQEDFYFAALSGGRPYGEPLRTTEELAQAAVEAFPMVYLFTVPLMHGAASYTLFTALLGGSGTVLMRRFDPVETLRLVQDEKVNIITVVGDAIARPLADALAAHHAEYDLSALFVIGSGGAIFSRTVRAELAQVLPKVLLRDGFGASESGVDGQIEVGADGLMRLAPNPRVTVIDDRFQPIPAGSDDIGFVARSGHVPLGYHNDPEKTAKTFPVIDGVRWSVLGDMARVEADGTIVVLGRGSGCINTGGEKVFPEEVEQALKSHPAVLDVLVAGVDDERFGQRVAAAVELRPEVPAPGVEELRAHVRSQLAGYKVPTRIRLVDGVVRSPSGKADYRWAKRVLTDDTVPA